MKFTQVYVTILIPNTKITTLLIIAALKNNIYLPTKCNKYLIDSVNLYF